MSDQQFRELAESIVQDVLTALTSGYSFESSPASDIPSEASHMQTSDVEDEARKFLSWVVGARSRPLRDAHNAVEEYIMRCEYVMNEVLRSPPSTGIPQFMNLLDCSRVDFCNVAKPAVFSLCEEYNCALFDRWSLLADAPSDAYDAWEMRAAAMRERMTIRAQQAVQEAAKRLVHINENDPAHFMFSEDVTFCGEISFPRPSCICDGFVIQAWRNRNIGRLFSTSFATVVEEAIRGSPIYAPFCVALSFYGILFTATILVPLISPDSPSAPQAGSLPFVVKEASEYLFSTGSVRNTSAAQETQVRVGADGRIYALNVVCSFADRMYGKHPSAEDMKMIRFASRQIDGARQRRAAGINVRAVFHGLRLPVRYIGYVYQNVKTDSARSLLLDEMCSRAFRDLLAFRCCSNVHVFREGRGPSLVSLLWGAAKSDLPIWTKLVLPYVAEKFELQKTRLPISGINIPSVLLLTQMRCGISSLGSSCDIVVSVDSMRCRPAQFRCETGLLVFADQTGGQKAHAMSYLSPKDSAHAQACPASVWFDSIRNMRSADLEQYTARIVDIMETGLHGYGGLLQPAKPARVPLPSVINSALAFLSAMSSFSLRLATRKGKRSKVSLSFLIVFAQTFVKLLTQFALRDLDPSGLQEGTPAAQFTTLRHRQLSLLFPPFSCCLAQQIVELHRHPACSTGQTAVALSEALVRLTESVNQHINDHAMFAQQFMHWQYIFAGDFHNGCRLHRKLVDDVRKLHPSSELLEIPAALFAMYSSATGRFRAFVKTTAGTTTCEELADWLFESFAEIVASGGQSAMGKCVASSLHIIRAFLIGRNFVKADQIAQRVLNLLQKHNLASQTLSVLSKTIHHRAAVYPEVIIQRAFREHLTTNQSFLQRRQSRFLIQRVIMGYRDRVTITQLNAQAKDEAAQRARQDAEARLKEQAVREARDESAAKERAAAVKIQSLERQRLARAELQRRKSDKARQERERQAKDEAAQRARQDAEARLKEQAVREARDESAAKEGALREKREMNEIVSVEQCRRQRITADELAGVLELFENSSCLQLLHSENCARVAIEAASVDSMLTLLNFEQRSIAKDVGDLIVDDAVDRYRSAAMQSANTQSREANIGRISVDEATMLRTELQHLSVQSKQQIELLNQQISELIEQNRALREKSDANDLASKDNEQAFADVLASLYEQQRQSAASHAEQQRQAADTDAERRRAIDDEPNSVASMIVGDTTESAIASTSEILKSINEEIRLATEAANSTAVWSVVNSIVEAALVTVDEITEVNRKVLDESRNALAQIITDDIVEAQIVTVDLIDKATTTSGDDEQESAIQAEIDQGVAWSVVSGVVEATLFAVDDAIVEAERRATRDARLGLAQSIVQDIVETTLSTVLLDLLPDEPSTPTERIHRNRDNIVICVADAAGQSTADACEQGVQVDPDEFPRPESAASTESRVDETRAVSTMRARLAVSDAVSTALFDHMRIILLPGGDFTSCPEDFGDLFSCNWNPPQVRDMDEALLLRISRQPQLTNYIRFFVESVRRQRIERMFFSLDVYHCGFLQRQTLCPLLRQLILERSPQLDDESVEDATQCILRLADRDHDGEIGYHDFLEAVQDSEGAALLPHSYVESVWPQLLHELSFEETSELKTAFDALDADHDGKLSRGDIEGALRELPDGQKSAVRSALSTAILNLCDLDQDNALTFDEFCSTFARDETTLFLLLSVACNRIHAEDCVQIMARNTSVLQRFGRGLLARRRMYYRHLFNPRRKAFTKTCRSTLKALDDMITVVVSRNESLRTQRSSLPSIPAPSVRRQLIRRHAPLAPLPPLKTPPVLGQSRTLVELSRAVWLERSIRSCTPENTTLLYSKSSAPPLFPKLAL